MRKSNVVAAQAGGGGAAAPAHRHQRVGGRHAGAQAALPRRVQRLQVLAPPADLGYQLFDVNTSDKCYLIHLSKVVIYTFYFISSQ